MCKNTFHIDPVAGDDANDGVSPERPLKTYAAREFSGGDTVLFKRGSVIRDMLHTRHGSDWAPITYGAYGEGEKPAFLGSVPVGDAARWVEERPAVWRYTGTLASEVCNLVFNDGDSCGLSACGNAQAGHLRWRAEDLRHAGEWHYTGIGATSAGESGNAGGAGGVLYLCSSVNPGLAYSGIECVLWGQRKLVGGQCHVVLENLSFRNAGVHGFWAMQAQQVVIRQCDFRHIGGAVWNRERKIRFGNAIELWDGASDVTVEGCRFEAIYDSGVTHQGGETRNIPARLYFRNNLFIDCGMAAYECREPSREVYFEHNTCVITGGGFGLQGEPPPRQSEIHPQPMGHHVFIWRIDPDTQPGPVYIRHNIFGPAPQGAALYSIIDPVDERKLVLDHNGYHQPTGDLLIHLGGRSYRPSEFSRYQTDSGQDRHSVAAAPLFVDATRGDYRLRDASPCQSKGVMQTWCAAGKVPPSCPEAGTSAFAEATADRTA